MILTKNRIGVSRELDLMFTRTDRNEAERGGFYTFNGQKICVRGGDALSVGNLPRGVTRTFLKFLEAGKPHNIPLTHR